MSESRYELLPWDTNFFGWPIARITARSLSAIELNAVLAELKTQSVRLVYWATGADDMISHTAATTLGGQLVDKKTTFAQQHAPTAGAIPERVESYPMGKVSPSLQELAIQAGLYSRFRIDPRLGENKFKKLYAIWVERSVKREIAQDVLVIRDQNLPDKPTIALATVGEKNQRGDIGLVAVDSNYRGQGLGTTIVQGALAWFKQHGYAASQVVTQGTNTAACRLYEKCGYQIETVEYWYHFWLNNQ